MNPIIRITPIGNLGNRMLQYMAALKLQELVPDAIVEQINLPEWGLTAPASDQGQRLLLIDQANKFDLEALSGRLRSGEIPGVELRDFLQDVTFYRDRSYYDCIFKPLPGSMVGLPEFGRDDLVINVRAGDVLRGVGHYPMVPISFYKSIISETDLKPVIMGQIDEGLYGGELRRAFPEARFIPSQGPIRDFQMVRSAHNIVPSVSTFSWLAAWLSDASAIYQPLLGFYNPCHTREINLVSIGDPRWKFYLFPLCYGLPEAEMLEFHRRVGRCWVRISHAQASYIIAHRPFIPRRPGLVGPRVDCRWYVSQYPKASMEISEGWYEDPQHHYEEVGHLRGYRPNGRASPVRTVARRLDIVGENLAFGRPTLQSSVSKYSNASSVEADSAGAVNGDFEEPYGFHTDEEERPWWQVQLSGSASIHAVFIYNRTDHPEIAARAEPLAIQLSDNGVSWTTVYTTSPNGPIRGTDGEPLVWQASKGTTARYVRLQVLRRSFLHLVEVEVYGIVEVALTEEAPDSRSFERADSIQAHGTG
jgi:hypothetical protein